MNQDIFNYVQNQLSRAEARLLAFTVDPRGKRNLTRHILIKIEKHIRDFEAGGSGIRWIIMPGLRGVGKTTVLAQTYEKLKKTYPFNRVLYVSLDEAKHVMGFSLKDILSAYEHILGSAFEKQTEPFFLLLDEVQVDPTWAAVLKSLHERSKKAFVFCTGSSAVSLQTNPDVIRRAAFEKLFPMSFIEYQMIRNKILPQKGLKSEIRNAVYHAASPTESLSLLKRLEVKKNNYWSQADRLEIDHYLRVGTFPFALHFNDTVQVYDAINQLLDKIILTDIRSLSKFDLTTLNGIKRLLFIIADTDAISINKLTKLLGMNHVTLAAVFDVLEQAELVVKVSPYGANTGKVKKPSKLLFMSPAIRASLLSIGAGPGTLETRRGKYLEDVVALHLYREFISPGIASLAYDVSLGSADFILQMHDSRQIAIEVGAGAKGIGQAQNTIEHKGCDFGIVISANPLSVSVDGKILNLPLDYFFLM